VNTLVARRHAFGLVGLAALALAALLPPAAPADTQRTVGEPLAVALAPLGPIKAMVSAALWTRLLRGQTEGDSAAAESLALALLELHPDLDEVREYLAHRLVVSEARRAPDRERHRLAVTRGLQILDEGLARRDSPRLHGYLGRLLAVRPDMDPWFRSVVEQYWGDTPEELAIESLRRSDAPQVDAWLLADLLVERGLWALEARDDPWRARRDLAEAEAVLAAVAGGHADEAQALLAPLRSEVEGR
jgi:hypothetical protein